MGTYESNPTLREVTFRHTAHFQWLATHPAHTLASQAKYKMGSFWDAIQEGPLLCKFLIFDRCRKLSRPLTTGWQQQGQPVQRVRLLTSISQSPVGDLSAAPP